MSQAADQFTKRTACAFFVVQDQGFHLAIHRHNKS
jgi:hypothetical protein